MSAQQDQDTEQKLAALDAVPNDIKGLTEKERMELRAKKFGVVDQPKKDDYSDRRSSNRYNRRKSDYNREDDRDQFGRERRPSDRRRSDSFNDNRNRKRRRNDDEDDDYDKYNVGTDDRGKRRKLR